LVIQMEEGGRGLADAGKREREGAGVGDDLDEHVDGGPPKYVMGTHEACVEADRRLKNQ
jgi:hypothetical protein